MQSRYYNPAIGRFINADALVSTGQGTLGNNMFAYCGNNPASRADPSGRAYVQIDYNFEGSVDRMLFVLGGGSGGGCAYALCAASSGAKVIRNLKRKLESFVNNESETAAHAYLKEYGVAFYKGTPVFMTELPFEGSAFSLGIIVMDNRYAKTSTKDFSDVLKHERGHTTHLSQIGVPAYVATVAIPSLIGAGLSYLSPFIDEHYESLPWENIAEQLGGVNGEYLPGATTMGTIYWIYTLFISAVL